MSDDRARVFISYSRVDSTLVDEIVSGLEWAGFDAIIDRESISEGEDWRARLGALIADADTVLAILSPSSLRSDVFAWEIEKAHSLSKRLLPVLAEPTGDLAVPPVLATLNYVRFDPFEDGRARSFMAGLDALTRALKTDLAWLREHTRLLARATEWDGDGRPATRLLRGTDIVAAKEWVAQRPKDAPETTELHHLFIAASERAEEERTNEERRRLEEVAAAQQERAQALDDRESAFRKIRRRTFLGIAGTSVFAAGAGVASYRTVVAEEQAELDRRQKEEANNALQESTEELQNWQRLIADDGNGGPDAIQGGPVEVVRTAPAAPTPPVTSPGQEARSWALEAIAADRSAADGSGVVMAHIGAGVEVENPAFAAMELIQRDFTGEGNGDRNGHGTHLGSVTYGKPVDGRNVSVAPGVRRVLVAKVLGASGAGTLETIPAALDWITKFEDGVVDVVFMGLGFGYPALFKRLDWAGDPAVESRAAVVLRRFLQELRTIESISLAASARGSGMTFVTAAGNDSWNLPRRVPVTSPNAVAKGFLSVGAVERSEAGYRVANYSNSEVTLCAPGAEVPAAALGGGWTRLSGTSIAAGIAAGAAALWWDHLRRRSPPGEKVTAEAVWRAMSARLETSGFAPEVGESERGQGLVRAPVGS